MTPRFGVAIDAGAPDGALLARLDSAMPVIEAAEEAGFDSVWFGEGYARGPDDPRASHVPSPFLVIATLARRTGLDLGTGVTLLRAWHPLRLAHDAAVLDQLTEGRLIVGLGLGPGDLGERFGSTWGSAQIDQALETLRVAWSGVQQPGTSGVWPPTYQPGGPPLLVGGGTKRGVDRAARLGDGWYASSGYSHERIMRLAAMYFAAAQEAGSQGPRAVVINRIALAARNAGLARDRARGPLGALVDKYLKIGTLPVQGPEPDAAQRRADAWDQLVLCGDPERIRTALAPLIRAGVTSVQFRVFAHGIPVEDAVESVRLIGHEVIPWCRSEVQSVMRTDISKSRD
jgi:alkanesulfonate monooxygenase SsuD/methylene tetrahydromethanopterin reductase-like flavin-dependent oxidoreductase (luciferase family)